MDGTQSEDDNEKSLKLSKFLSANGLSPLQLAVNRQAITYELDIYNAFSINENTYVIQSGSSADGVALFYSYGSVTKSSDLDLVVIYKDVPVSEIDTNDNDWVIKVSDPKCIGYARLWVKRSEAVCNICEYVDGNYYLSSRLMVETNKQKAIGTLKKVDEHGPALDVDLPPSEVAEIFKRHQSIPVLRIDDPSFTTQSSTGVDKTDQVYCVESQTWPAEADEWKSRQRLYDWPKSDLVEQIVQTGCIFAPVGSKESIDEIKRLQWRISFNKAEALLTRSFNETQMGCYVLLKMFNVEILKHVSNKCTTSYIMKLTIFWVSESMMQEEWQPQTLISCFLKCISKLRDWVMKQTSERKHGPHQVGGQSVEYIDSPPSGNGEQTSDTSNLEGDAVGCIDEKHGRISTKDGFHKCLIDVDDELGDEDVANLKFLCRDFIPVAKLEKASRALDIFDILERSAKISVGNVDFVLECLLEMHRLDLIKKFGFDPNSVRQKAGQGSVLGPTPFRKLLFELAEDLSDDEVRRIKFVLKNEYLKRGNLQSLETAQELFIFLEKEGKLSAENVQVLYDIFKTIKREELVRQVDQYFRPEIRDTQTGLGPSRFQRATSFPQTYGLMQPMNGNAPSNLQQNLGFQGRQVPGINRSSSAGTIELEESGQPLHPVFSDITLLKIAADMKDISFEDVCCTLGITQNEGLQYKQSNPMERVYKLLKYWRDMKMKDTPGQVLPALYYICEKFGKKTSVQTLNNLAQVQQTTYEFQARTDQTASADHRGQLPYQRTQTLEQQGVQTLGPGQLEPRVLNLQAGFRDGFGQMGPQQTWQPLLYNDFITGSDQVRPRLHFEQVEPQQGMVRPQGNIGQVRSQVQEPVEQIRSQAQQPVSPGVVSEPLPHGQGQTRPQQMTPTVRNIDLETDFPCYKMDAKPRGICLIISNRTFTVAAEDADSKEMPARQGTEKDMEYLSQIFRKLHFIVQVKEDLKDFEMARALVDIAQNTDHTRYDCFVCCILSHGALGHVFGSNGKLIPIRDLTSCVQANRCHTLAGKPKLFFIQACQGREKQEGTEIEADGPSIPEDLEIDSGSGEMIPNEADFLLGYATVPGYVSFRSRTSGSWYIRKLVQMLDRYHDKTDLMSIMVKVNEEVSKADANVEAGRYKQTPAPFVTLRKRLFFY